MLPAHDVRIHVHDEKFLDFLRNRKALFAVYALLDFV